MLLREAIIDLRNEDTKELLTAMNIERLEGIIEKAMNESDLKTAIKAIDTQNKMNGAYTEKIEISGDDEITLNFNL